MQKKIELGYVRTTSDNMIYYMASKSGHEPESIALTWQSFFICALSDMMLQNVRH